ncbi:MAG: dihydropteroate synthase, partial [Candidatus Neomarinimicrobiota bacterium]|nr:dihydropteroate synthase [Candidatus Neomarinimicrobiota bacterium]
MNKEKFNNWLEKPEKCLIMGIINMTPDSFSDGGNLHSTNQAIDFAYKLIDNGADIVDIGGESSRPGANPISDIEEINRISPLIEELGKNTNCLISIDTYKPTTAKFALDNGVDI